MQNDLIEKSSATIWLVNDIPTRMVYTQHRWRITDIPTRLRESIWAAPLGEHPSLYGWRFQATNETTGESFVFDVFKQADDQWHVHKTYA